MVSMVVLTGLIAILLQMPVVVTDQILAASLATETAVTDKHEVVARVNTQPITSNELQRVQVDILELNQRRAMSDKSIAKGRELEEHALQQLIERRLLLQEASRRGIRVDDGDFDRALTVLRNRFHNLESFGKWMEKRQLDDLTLIETVKDDMLANLVLTSLVEHIQVTDTEIKDYYNNLKENVIIGKQVRLSIIEVPTKANAEEILTALRKGQNFSRLARAQSIGRLSSKGGDMGWVNPNDLPYQIQRIVAGLKKGEVSKPIQKNAEEYLIVGLQERRATYAKNLIEARPIIEHNLLSAKRHKFVHDWFDDQKAKSNIEIYH